MSERRGVLQRPGESPGVRELSELFMGEREREREERREGVLSKLVPLVFLS